MKEGNRVRVGNGGGTEGEDGEGIRVSIKSRSGSYSAKVFDVSSCSLFGRRVNSSLDIEHESVFTFATKTPMTLKVGIIRASRDGRRGRGLEERGAYPAPLGCSIDRFAR